ncbi:MAG: DUF2807 domain-containing protein [Alphaproteobacteria bacterium]|nr:DUF2807 domain-containing protein [Alphaproteobacteria bacterium]MBL6939688.1 DUF2807 domain-containing protein [Alphaproteobacteria bacterium]MBL7096990.1 DUF2807 domain-containing protein [Alphaproteobacteria bacterium]
MTSYLLRAALALFCAAPAVAQASETVNVGHFDSVALNGGGRVILRHGATQSVVIRKGSAQITHFVIKDGHTLKIDQCENNCPSSYDLEIEITTPDIEAVALNGGGEIGTEGSFPIANEIAAAINGGGEIDVSAIPAKSATAAINGGGEIKLAASDRLTAAVRGGGDIAYRGHPQVTQAIQGGGSVERLD